MLDGYWLFGEPNTVIARDPARLNEYISLFKHACLFQREVNLSDLMVIASPNFREAYRTDADFRQLVASDWVNFWYMHQNPPGQGEGQMDLVSVKDFHHKKNLYGPEERRYFSREGSDDYLYELQKSKAASTLRQADSRLRDPIFTQRILDTLDCAYLQHRLGEYHTSFTQFTRELQAELAAEHIPLGAIHFEASRTKDGTYRWGTPTSLDRLYEHLGNNFADAQRRHIADAVWRYYRTHLVGAELDLMSIDPIVPPENDFYVQVRHAKDADDLVARGGDQNVKVYSMSTALDDSFLYRNLDFKTIESIRNQNAALELFKVSLPPPPPPGITDEASIREQTLLANDFSEALSEYRRSAERLLTQRFSECCKPSLSRTVLLTVGASLGRLAVDSRGQPRPVITTTVKASIAGAVSSWAPALHPYMSFLTYFLSPWLRDADTYVSRVTEALAGRTNTLRFPYPAPAPR